MINEMDVRKTYRILRHGGGCTEVRFIDPHKLNPPRSKFPTNEEEFVKACAEGNGQWNVYVGINQRRGETTKAENVRTVNIIAIDLDAVREKGEAATDDELQKVIEYAKKINTELQEKFGTPGELLMSGNGVQIWLPVEITVNNENRKEVAQKLAVFQEQVRIKYENELVEIDSIGDLPRILKVGGTLSIKGSDTKERPRRIAKWLTAAENIQTNTGLQNYIETLEMPKPKAIIPVQGSPRQELDWILEHDKKFKEMFYTSPSPGQRSENEFGVVCKLIFYNQDFGSIDSIMQGAPCGEKWRISHRAYKITTFNNAESRQTERFKPREGTKLNDVYEKFQKWMCLRDTYRIDIVLATRLLASERGEPVWIFMIAPSGDGKTEFLRSFRDPPFTREIEKITPNTLVSGMEDVEDLAPQLDEKLVVIWDMAQLLTMNVDDKRAVWSQLRDLYDGKAGKDTGSGKHAKYDNIYCCLLGASTSSIDQQILIHQDLGTRELLWREEDAQNQEKHQELMEKVWDNAGKEAEMRRELNGVVKNFIHSKKLKDVEINGDVKKQIMLLAEYTRTMRCSCSIDHFSGQLTTIIEPEMPTRILKQYKRIYKGLKSLDDGYDDARAMAILKRIAMSTVNPIRAKIYEILKEKEDLKNYTRFNTNQIAERMKIGWKTAFAELNILWALDLVELKSTYDPEKAWKGMFYEWKLKKEIGI